MSTPDRDRGPAPFVPWPLQWRPEQVVRFWDWRSRNLALEHQYYSKRLGDDLFRYLRGVFALRGVLLDLGCGPGHLVDKALAEGMEVRAIDSSPESVAALNQRLAGARGFHGALLGQVGQVPMPDESGDVVAVIETVEHLDDAQLGDLLKEAWRLTRRGGHVVITTPNEEPLGELEVMCPSCGCVFHQYQHVRSFSSASLRGLMEAQGFATRRCHALLLSFLPRWMRPFHRWVYPRVKGRLPHLVYVGQRP
ncbi:MAG TPA: class I SAM-dependent methyltransferase [Vicinamibacteria bacterium]|nr:class I SAM-dependent methyltransferase [Vicinamibacteria bacterium]